MCRVLNLQAEIFEDIRGESDSIAGLILEISGRFPKINETVAFKEFKFTVLELEKMRIKRVKLRIQETEQ
jgi:CBS domain containing-hemolysin-like protein